MQAISLSIGVLFPYPYYGIGVIGFPLLCKAETLLTTPLSLQLVFYLPFICQLAIRLAVIFFIFPETLAHQFSFVFLPRVSFLCVRLTSLPLQGPAGGNLGTSPKNHTKGQRDAGSKPPNGGVA